MNTPLPWVLLALLFAVCAVREASPEALTPRQIRDRIQAYGWRRIVGRTVQIAIVLVLLLLAACCQFCWHALQGLAVVLAVLAAGIGSLDPRPELGEAS